MNEPHLSPARILIVEDHPLVAEGLAAALASQGAEVAVASVPLEREILHQAEQLRPNLVLLDLRLGGELESSIGLIDPLRTRGASVLMLTGVDEVSALAECVEAGALGILSKRADFCELIDAVGRALLGDTTHFERQRRELLTALRELRSSQHLRLAPLRTLTPRETEVLSGLVDGHSAEELASLMYVSVATVRSQIRSILRKLGVNSQLAAVAVAHRAGLGSDQPRLREIRAG